MGDGRWDLREIGFADVFRRRKEVQEAL